MANYTFLDAYGSVKTAFSSTIGGVELPVIKISDPVSVVGTLSLSGNPSISGTVGASVIGTVPVVQSGTVISSISGTVVVQSIVGTYAEDAAHASADAGLFSLGVRNDTMASVASADGDYTYHAVGPVGETLVANAPITKWVSGTTSTVSGSAAVASVALIAAQGSSIFTYLTSAQIYNSGATSALITFTSGGSILGYGQAPTGGGGNMYMPNAMKSRPNASIDISASAASSVISVSGQGFISKV